MRTRLAVVMSIVVSLVFISGAALAQSDVEQEVAERILAGFKYSQQNKADMPGTVSKHGSLEFWSSGGLLQEVSPEPVIASYESFTLNPKHIRVIPLADDVAVALYYSEGSFQSEGSAVVPHYLTRALEVYVKEGGEWKVRASHWSPIAAGTGTNQTAVRTEE